MFHKKGTALLAVVSLLVIAALACGTGGGATQTPAAKPTDTPKAPQPVDTKPAPASELAVVSTYAYVDAYDYYHVVGEVRNDSAKPVTSVELTISIQDASGQTLLKDSNDQPVDSLTFSLLLYTLAPGETSPFDYYIGTTNGMPDKYEVSITGQQTGQVDRADVEVQNAQLMRDASTLYLTGEVVNLGDQPALVNSMAGAALDADGNVIAADYTLTLTRYLAPAGDSGGNDRSPFLITLDAAEEGEYQDIATYLDADVTDPTELTGLSLEITAGYFDTYDSFHLVGTVTNNGNETLNVGTVAGLYDTDGMVVDAGTTSLPIYVEPGATVPFQYAYWSNVNWNAEAANAVDTFSVQFDPYWTYSTSFEVVSLETTNDDASDDGDGQWTYTGDVENASGKALSSIYVIVAVVDADDNLVATEYTSIYPDGDEIAPGDTNSYEVTVRLDPDVDTTGFQYITIAQGLVK